MAHIVLNYQTAARLGVEYGLHSAEVTADFLGLDIAHVIDVCEHHAYPSEEFIAAAMSRLTVRFDDLFIVLDDAELIAA